MGIKAKENTCHPKYPYIGQFNGKEKCLVLFTKSKTGTCILGYAFDNNNKTPIGQHKTDWNEYFFEYYRGQVTLKNR
jgi:hypothetical protein